MLVGAGPTGVEMAGQIGEIAHDLSGEFRWLDLHEAQIVVVETGDRVLQEYPPSLSAKALRSLQSLGVTMRLSHTVTDLDDESVTLRAADGSEERIATQTVVWAAGVIGSELASLLAQQAGLDVDRTGRIEVSEDLSLPGHPEVLAIGDMIRVRQAFGPPVALPGIAPVAMQEGRHAAAVVKDRLEGRPERRFHYFDKGNLATIGRARAVADIKGIHLSGFIAWVTWLTVHLYYLIGFENRLLVLTRWAFSFVTHGRGARLIVGEAEAPNPLRRELKRPRDRATGSQVAMRTRDCSGHTHRSRVVDFGASTSGHAANAPALTVPHTGGEVPPRRPPPRRRDGTRPAAERRWLRLAAKATSRNS